MKRRLAKLLTAASLGLFLSLGAFGIPASTVFAADPTSDALVSVGGETGLSDTDPKIIIGNIIRTGLGVLGIILVVIVVYGGFVWMTANGEEEKIEKARKILLNAVIGLIIILLSWSIATFVISSLTDATGGGGGDGGGGGGGGGYGLGGSSSSTFNVTGYSPEGTVLIRNIVPRITFSRAIDETTVDGNVVISDASGTPVDGKYVTSGNTVKFTPTFACPDPNSSRFCFDENATFTITVSTGLLSTSGTAIVCDTSNPCSSTFTSGSLVDTENPLANITVPEGTISTNSTVDFQVSATDDAGVSGADFFVDSEWQDSISADGTTGTTVSTIIDTESFVNGTRYTFKTTVVDFAGNEDSDSVSVRAKPEWCFNGALDADLGETGMDCGGDSSLTTYCGACDGSSCTTSEECSSGVCTDGVCTTNPAISGISPEDGAVGTYVTISGTDFGANTGSVLFTDSVGTGTVEGKVLSSCGGGWSDTQVVVVVPEGAGDGPVSIITGNDVTDSTDDENGALVPNFDVNSILHPGLCSLSKYSGTSTSALSLYGANFGDTQGSSTVLFSSTAAGSYTSWTDATVKITIPQAAAASYDVGVVVDGLTSNTLSFAVTSVSVDASTITDISPSEGGIGQYVTILGTNFGSAVGTVTFTGPTGDTATGSIDFPSVCSSDFWDADQVIVIVPESFDNGDDVVAGDYSVTITNQSGVTSSAVDFTVTEDAPTPGICNITASADVGDSVTINGDHFGLSTDTITFYSGVTSIAATSWGSNTVKIAVPSGSVTGPVTVKVAGVESNSANLTVGATDTSEETSSVFAAYAWDFSTGEIAKAPAVVSECSADTVSAVPNNTFSEQSEICVNAVVYAEFTMLMNEATVADSVSVLKCTAAVSSPSDDACATTESVSGTATVASSSNASRVTWIPNEEFSANTTYQITVSKEALSADSVAMARNAEWEFTTSTSTEHCVIDRVTVTPPTENIAVIYDTAGFGANAGTGCVVVDSSDYSWDWSVDSYSYVDFNTKEDSDCIGDPTACATLEALAEGTTLVTATALNAGGAGDVSDDSSLVVNFSDPYISDYKPDCDEACTNGLIGATFNTGMTASDVTTNDNIVLYSCSNELCTNLTFVDSNPSCVYGSEEVTSERCLGFAFPEEPLAASSYYRVIVSGNITSESGVALIRTNYGSDFSWTFRVREDGTACSVERVSLSPASVVVAEVGATKSFAASAFGAADSCSTSGQELVGADYNWGWENPILDDEQNTETAGYTAAWKNISSELFDGGDSAIPEGCSSVCTPVGSSPYQAVCGDGILDKDSYGGGEECDDGNTTNNDGCSSTCLYEGASVCSFTCTSTGTSCTADSQCVETCDTSTSKCSISGTACTTNSDCAYVAATCDVSGSNCCGNSAIEVAYSSDIAENCDDGNLVDGDGCSSTCLAEGSASVGATCGNSDIAFDPTTRAGEVCDDGNNASGDGCSRACLPEGSQSLAALGNSLCGDGEITSPYETCDDENIADGDGCSSVCVREGLAKCATSTSLNCCGNATIDQEAADSTSENSGGEDCDPAAGVEGCSKVCTFEGSSISYESPSVCGDGVQGIGEYDVCEPSSSAGDGKVDPLQVAYMTNESVLEVNPDTKMAIGTVTLSVAEAPGLSTSSNFTLTCSAQNDQHCSDPATTGVGDSNCCVPRPEMTSSAPSGAAVCRNAAIYGVFSQEMDVSSFTYKVETNGVTTSTPYMYLKLNVANGQTCPTGYTTLAISNTSFFANVLKIIRTFFLGEAQAATAGTSTDCILPIAAYSQEDIGTATTSSFKVALQYEEALEASSSYTLVIVGDDYVADTSTEGVRSALGAGMNGTESITFTTGADICTLDQVLVEDTDTGSPNTFTSTEESHTFTATAISFSNDTRQEITQLPGVYDWTWSAWDSSDDSLFTAKQGSATDTGTVAAVGDNGDATIVATATISDFSTGVEVKSTEDGSTDVTALLCENPWPALASFPWTDDASGDSGAAEGKSGYMNFSISYCQDYGTDDLLTDDLPDVNVVLAPSLPSSKVLKEYLYEIDEDSSTSASDDAGDVIGVRILSNADYLSPMAWYEEQGFGGGPAETTVDGFQAVTDDRSTYIGMANSTTLGMYANIFVISYNEGASAVTQAVYNKIIENLSFLTNVTSTAVCSSSASKSCSADADCGSGNTCLDVKSKIMRDTDRMGDLKDVSIAVSAYGEENRTCSSTASQTCSEDGDCPDEETCEAIVPVLSSGTAVRSMASSAWASWTESFGGALSSNSLPTDPLNTYATCTDYDSATCVNQTSGAYSCPTGSHVYHYRAVGARDYELATDLEYTTTPSWINPFESDTTDEVSFLTSSYCDGDVYGTSSACGDGIIGSAETCEIGDVEAAACITTDGEAGTANAECNSTCTGYDSVSASATCSANSCGDGVKNGSETCDDGAMNGEYGYCGDLCDYSTATFCGDGVISGGEACDCGDSTASSSVLADSRPYVGTSGWCAGLNGAYATDLNTTCAWDCSGPASYCGDATVDSGESCDGTEDAWAGSLCSDGITQCTTSAECGSGTCGPWSGAACPEAYVCVGGSYDGFPCSITAWPASVIDAFSDQALLVAQGVLYLACLKGADGDINAADDNGTCDSTGSIYQTYRTRTCDDANSTSSICGWNSWNYCNYNGQTCGNGTIDGTEECDDGNDIATDECTTACTLNVCGDAYIYDGIEECDEGSENGAGCDSAYESTCTACSTSCYYTTASGEFCGDGVINGSEYCDGADVPYSWYNTTIGTNGTCTTLGDIDTSLDISEGSFTICSDVGICNGGYRNGELCTQSEQYSSSGGFSGGYSDCNDSADTAFECVKPVCAASCSSSCPVSESTSVLLMTANLPGSAASSIADLYTYSSSSTSDLPNGAIVTIPACTVGTSMIADIDTSSMEPEDTYVMFAVDINDYAGSSGMLEYEREAVQAGISQVFSEFGDNAFVGVMSVDSVETVYTSTADTYFYGSDEEARILSEVDNYVVGDSELDLVDLFADAETAFAAAPENSKKILIYIGTEEPTYKNSTTDIDYSTATDAALNLIAAGVEIISVSASDDTSVTGYLNAWSSNMTSDAYNEIIASASCSSKFKGIYALCVVSNGVSVNSPAENPDSGFDYSYEGGADEDTFRDAYSEAVNSITGARLTLISSDGEDIVYSSTSVDGSNEALPWPDGFVCDATAEQELSVRLDFNGSGTVNIENIRFASCAP